MSNPQEKAKKLYNKFYYNDKIQAKQCAIIAVDEILLAIDWQEFEYPNDEFEYWHEVKAEIEKL